MTRERFIELIIAEQEGLRRFLLGLCGGDASLADDLAQEALLKAYLCFERFEGRAKFSTWLLSIAYRCFYDNARRPHLPEVPPSQQLPEPVSDDAAPSFESQRLYKAIAQLSETEKAIVLLFYMEEKSIKEIMLIMGLPSGTVRSHLSRARAKLRAILRSPSF